MSLQLCTGRAGTRPASTEGGVLDGKREEEYYGSGKFEEMQVGTRIGAKKSD